ncbi:hypothetical protein BU24DRAFT_493743 [Aaosphaeria arxii CBS 175.79]|uniref:Large ribosomal subunit protein mL54 n=1 Tax=Aaosphaeria arxii CBS 175.79 TaxID=1450172 RepID=A0A6A5XKE0_9PLEO|nr:uncharacterized protein BU24DRAFT_493743 [Aaosphaeria arxii CBS 175.79]KAF2013210.1 hypothetical protein BU24DRAFT_493743 [Aaosphaeria arxii CBS 175.79]
MICRNCLLRASTRSHFKPSTTSPRFLTTTSTRNNATPISLNAATQSAPRQGSPTSPHTPPAATSTSAAQPFSADTTTKKDHPPAPASKQQPLVKSSIPAGTPLKGLNFLKNKSDPIALEDSEYPSWLWDILKKKDGKGDGVNAGDLFSKSKKQRRLAAKRLRKEQLANPDLLAPKIPIYEQTIDLPAGDAQGSTAGNVEAAEARGELTKAMRDKRRAGIKEANFLKSMG